MASKAAEKYTPVQDMADQLAKVKVQPSASKSSQAESSSSPQLINKRAAIQRLAFIALILSIYSSLHGGNLVAQTVEAWRVPEDRWRAVELVLKSISAYGWWATLAWVAASLLLPS